MPDGRVIQLRKLLADRFPQEPRVAADRLPTGLQALDEATRGGLMKGAITEFSSPPPAAGTATLTAALLQQAFLERFFVALIDGRDSFDPASVERPVLQHLLWVRCNKTAEAIQAADLLLRDGNFPLVILDLMVNPMTELGQIPQSNWYRFQRLVEPAPVAFIALTPRSMINSAQCKLIVENHWSLTQLDWDATDLQARLKFRVRRAQANNSKYEDEIVQVG